MFVNLLLIVYICITSLIFVTTISLKEINTKYMRCEIIEADCEKFLLNNHSERSEKFDLSFLDPPFNQNKEYMVHNDNMPEHEYWDWMKRVCKSIFSHTSDGGAIYFMQREKNVRFVSECLESSGWVFQNLIIWKKKTSAVPLRQNFGKHYQIIVFATKGKKPRIFNKLRIDPPLLVTDKYCRQRGIYVTNVWDDIRELTSVFLLAMNP